VPIILVLISVPLIVPFFHHGYFPTHDGEWAVVRLADMYRSLRDGQFPVRYSGYLNFGFGYPLFNFAYPFPYYLGIVPVLLKFGFINSIKLIFALTVPLSAICMYFCSESIWKNKWAGVLSAIFYIFLPYHLLDLYVRGSIGESVSFVLFPLILLGVQKIANDSKSYIWLAITSVALASLVATHNIMALLFAPILTCFIGGHILFTNKKLLLPYVVTFFLGLGAAAFFWIPAIAEKGNILLSVVPIADRSLYFVNLTQFVFPSWGYGTPTDSAQPFTYQLGLPLLVLVITSFVVFLYRRSITEWKTAIFAVLWIGMFVLLFSFTSPIWSLLPLLKEINYPWTLLGPLGFLSTLLAGYVVARGKVFMYLAVVLALVSISIFLPYARPEKYIDRADDFYVTNDATTTSSHELMPVWVKDTPSSRSDVHARLVTGDATVTERIFASNRFDFSVTATKSGAFEIQRIYYPGWKIEVNGVPSKISYSNPRGLLTIPVPDGESRVTGTFTETSLRLVANVLSLVSIIVLAGISMVGIKRCIKK
jgi:hypothetical protein